ncbi:zinc finger and BTB domain-containing protein 24-like, partial [Trematomus bernacchii]|uniref:zinc finger and BTB domain-containing protein 24-like n=1 Tax=Trematomus bernacchii TaxID=40690 RepID=UPI00146D2600
MGAYLETVLQPQLRIHRAGELEEKLSRSKEENERLQKRLDAVLQPQLRIHRADVQQLVVVKEELLPNQQEWSTPPHIKQQQEELRISQEGEQLQDQEEAEITKSTFTPDPVKSKDDKKKPQSPQPHQRRTEHMETEADGDDCRGPEPARNSDPESSLQPKTGDSSETDAEDSSEPDTEHSSEPDSEHSDWEETRKPASGSNSQKNRWKSVSDSSRSAEKKRFSCSVCTKSFALSRSLNKHIRVHTGIKPFSCSVCKKPFEVRRDLNRHMRIHTGEKPFGCSVCTKSFALIISLKEHMAIHTGEKPHSCSVCKKAFAVKRDLNRHLRTHTGEKPFSCSACSKSFSQSGSLKAHIRVHTDVQQLVVVKEEVIPDQQEWITSLDQEDPEPPPHIKQEQEELRIFQEGEQLLELEEADITKSTFTPDPVKSEDDKEKPRSSQPLQRQTEHMETEADGDDCRGPEPARNSDP